MLNNIISLHCSETLNFRFLASSTNPPIQQSNSAKRRLTFDNEGTKKIQKVAQSSVQNSQKKTLSELYGMELEKPTFGQLDHEFFSLRDEILSIEDLIEKHIPEVKKNIARSNVKQVFTSKLLFEEKLSELGFIHFKLEKKKFPLFRNQLLSNVFINEIIQEFQRRELECKDLDPLICKKIPSGKVQYFLETLAQLIITSEGKFHKAGAYAALMILKDFNIIRQWSEEHLLQLETVIQKLIYSTEFALSLNKTLTLHPEMETCVKLDLKLPSSHKVTEVEAKRACLIALLFDLRQRNEPNCYAVSSLQTIIFAQPDAVFKKLLFFVEEGCFIFDNFHKISLFSLVKDRLILEQKMNPKIPENKASDLSIIQTVIQGMKVNSVQRLDETSEITLSEYVKKKAPNTPKKRTLLYGKKLFTAFYQNCLQKLLLAEIEFYQANKIIKISNLNLLKKNLLNFSLQESEKFSIIQEVTKILENAILQEKSFFSSDDRTFFELLKMQLNDWLWLSVSSEQNIKTIEESLWLNDVEVIRVNKKDRKKLSAFKNLFQRALYLIAILPTENKYIYTFEDLKEIIIKAANEVCQNAFSSNSKVIQVINKLKEKFNSHQFQCEFSKFLARYNKEVGKEEQKELYWKDFFDLERITFYHPGGIEETALSLYYIKAKKIELLKTPNINRFIELLCKSINTLQKDKIKNLLNPSTLLLCSSSDHLFTFTPSRIAEFWNDSHKSALDLVEEKIIKPGKNVLATSLSKNKIIKILKKVHEDPEINEILIELPDAISAEAFFKFMNKRKYSVRQLKILNEKFNSVLMEIPLTQIPIEKLLNVLKIHAEPGIISQIETEMEDYDEEMEIRQVASILRQEFLIRSLKKVSLHEIERHLSELMCLPIIFDMGDLNFADENASHEIPYHERLILRYDFVDQKLNFFQRSKYVEKKTDNEEILKEFTLLMIP